MIAWLFSPTDIVVNNGWFGRRGSSSQRRMDCQTSPFPMVGKASAACMLLACRNEVYWGHQWMQEGSRMILSSIGSLMMQRNA